MERLILVRHAQTVIDPTRHHAEWDLDPAGLARLEAMAALPLFAGAGRVVSSTEPKAVKTAGVIRRAHGLPQVEQFPNLRELHKGGHVPNHDEVMAELFRRPDRPVADGWEPAATALERFRSCLERLIAEAGAGDLIVVSHGTVISLYLAWLQGLDRVDFSAWQSVGFPDVAVISPVHRQIIQPFGAWQRP